MCRLWGQKHVPAWGAQINLCLTHTPSFFLAFSHNRHYFYVFFLCFCFLNSVSLAVYPHSTVGEKPTKGSWIQSFHIHGIELGCVSLTKLIVWRIHKENLRGEVQILPTLPADIFLVLVLFKQVKWKCCLASRGPVCISQCCRIGLVNKSFYGQKHTLQTH